jgi:hypothetical protein
MPLSGSKMVVISENFRKNGDSAGQPACFEMLFKFLHDFERFLRFSRAFKIFFMPLSGSLCHSDGLLNSENASFLIIFDKFQILKKYDAATQTAQKTDFLDFL